MGIFLIRGGRFRDSRALGIAGKNDFAAVDGVNERRDGIVRRGGTVVNGRLLVVGRFRTNRGRADQKYGDGETLIRIEQLFPHLKSLAGGMILAEPANIFDRVAAATATGDRLESRSMMTNSRARTIVAVVLILAAGAFAYSTGLSGPFIFDDLSISNNPTIRSVWPVWRAMRAPATSTFASRPLVNLSFAINYAISGNDVRGYHLTNIAIHLLAGAGAVRIATAGVSIAKTRRAMGNQPPRRSRWR